MITTNKPLVIAGVGFDVTEYIFPRHWSIGRIEEWLSSRCPYYAIFACPGDDVNPYICVGYY